MLGAFLFCIVLTGLGACTESNDNPVSPGDYGGGGDIDYDINNVEVIESGVMKTADIFDDIIEDNADLEDREDSIYYEWATEHKKYIISDEQAATRVSNEDRTGEDGTSDTGYLKNCKWVTIRYKTKSVTGADIWCSALVVWPYNAIRANPNPTNLIIGCHCTITSNDERPTNFSKLKTNTDVGVMALRWCASKANCLLVVPDYEGYGATHGSPHPYCNRDVTAVQVLDGAKAGLAWYTRNEKKMAWDWKTIAVGYSQGGAVAAGTYRYYREKKMDGMGFFGAICGDGPYDPLATLKEYIKQDKLYMPVAPALLLKGAVDTNKDLKALGCTYRDFVTDDFANTGIFDWLKEKKRNTEKIQTELLSISGNYEKGFKMYCWSDAKNQYLLYNPQNIRTLSLNAKWNLSDGNAKSYCTVDQCFKPGVIAYFKDGTIKGDVPEAKLKALEKALKENSLYYGDYKPGKFDWFTFFHSSRDEVVPYCNMQSVKNAWGDNAAKFQSYQSMGTFLHVGTGAAFYVGYANSYLEEMINRSWKSGFGIKGGLIF